MINAAHTISIPSILEVGSGKISSTGLFIKKKGFNNIAVFWGPGIKDMFGAEILQSFNDSNVNIVFQCEDDNTDVCSIMSKAFSLPMQTEIIAGIGGGRVLDVAKY